jgi:hypothetical protein
MKKDHTTGAIQLYYILFYSIPSCYYGIPPPASFSYKTHTGPHTVLVLIIWVSSSSSCFYPLMLHSSHSRCPGAEFKYKMWTLKSRFFFRPEYPFFYPEKPTFQLKDTFTSSILYKVLYTLHRYSIRFRSQFPIQLSWKSKDMFLLLLIVAICRFPLSPLSSPRPPSLPALHKGRALERPSCWHDNHWTITSPSPPPAERWPSPLYCGVSV